MVTFIEEKKKQKRLIYVLIIVLIITGLILWLGFFRRPAQVPEEIEKIEEIIPEVERVEEIDFTILESQLLKELQPFPEIEPFEEEIGRENPFLPY